MSDGDARIPEPGGDLGLAFPTIAADAPPAAHVSTASRSEAIRRALTNPWQALSSRGKLAFPKTRLFPDRSAHPLCSTSNGAANGVDASGSAHTHTSHRSLFTVDGLPEAVMPELAALDLYASDSQHGSAAVQPGAPGPSGVAAATPTAAAPFVGLVLPTDASGRGRSAKQPNSPANARPRSRSTSRHCPSKSSKVPSGPALPEQPCHNPDPECSLSKQHQAAPSAAARAGSAAVAVDTAAAAAGAAATPGSLRGAPDTVGPSAETAAGLWGVMQDLLDAATVAASGAGVVGSAGAEPKAGSGAGGVSARVCQVGAAPGGGSQVGIVIAADTGAGAVTIGDGGTGAVATGGSGAGAIVTGGSGAGALPTGGSRAGAVASGGSTAAGAVRSNGDASSALSLLQCAPSGRHQDLGSGPGQRALLSPQSHLGSPHAHGSSPTPCLGSPPAVPGGMPGAPPPPLPPTALHLEPMPGTYTPPSPFTVTGPARVPESGGTLAAGAAHSAEGGAAAAGAGGVPAPVAFAAPAAVTGPPPPRHPSAPLLSPAAEAAEAASRDAAVAMTGPTFAAAQCAGTDGGVGGGRVTEWDDPRNPMSLYYNPALHEQQQTSQLQQREQSVQPPPNGNTTVVAAVPPRPPPPAVASTAVACGGDAADAPPAPPPDNRAGVWYHPYGSAAAVGPSMATAIPMPIPVPAGANATAGAPAGADDTDNADHFVVLEMKEGRDGPSTAAAAAAAVASGASASPAPPDAAAARLGMTLGLRGRMAVYFSKWRGVGDTLMPAEAPVDVFWSWLGAFLSIMVVALLNQYLSPHVSLPLLIASFGASAVLLFGVPASKLAQPRNFLGGQVISAIVGVLVRLIFIHADDLVWLSASLGMSLALAAMQVTRTTHPPGGASALIAASALNIGPWHGFKFVLTVFFGCLAMLVVALLVNNLSSRRRYPTYWRGN